MDRRGVRDGGVVGEGIATEGRGLRAERKGEREGGKGGGGGARDEREAWGRIESRS